MQTLPPGTKRVGNMGTSDCPSRLGALFIAGSDWLQRPRTKTLRHEAQETLMEEVRLRTSSPHPSALRPCWRSPPAVCARALAAPRQASATAPAGVLLLTSASLRELMDDRTISQKKDTSAMKGIRQ